MVKTQNLHGDDRGDMDHSELCSVRYQGVCQLSMDIAGTVGSASMCRKASTLWILHVRKSQLCLHLTHWRDLQASISCNCRLEWDQPTEQVHKRVIHIHVCSLLHLPLMESLQHLQIWECAAWHHRSATPFWGATQCSVGQKGFNSTCWLESWVLSMTFHSAAWLIPTMVKIQELSQSYTRMTEGKWTTWRREWAVMAVHYVQSHWS